MSPTVPPPARSGTTSTTAQPLYWGAYGPGDADRVLVLHGGPGAHHDYLLPQMLALAERHALYFYDQRGSGRSKASGSAPVTASDLVEDLAHVVAELALVPLTLVGYSWGGLLALLYAIQAPRLRGATAPARLVLIDPAPVSRPMRVAFETEFARRQRGEAMRELREELSESGLRERDPAAWRQRQFELGVTPYFANPAAARNLTPFRVTERVQRSVWDSLGDYDLLPQLESLQVPTLIVHGRADPIPLESSELLGRAMRARLLVLEASGHVPFVEQPAPLFSAIERFLDDTVDHVEREHDASERR